TANLILHRELFTNGALVCGNPACCYRSSHFHCCLQEKNKKENSPDQNEN
ncbi:hypothetical protein M9458_045965, partial [Cirrhinus mrigala]